jgi:hypothetical protein
MIEILLASYIKFSVVLTIIIYLILFYVQHKLEMSLYEIITKICTIEDKENEENVVDSNTTYIVINLLVIFLPIFIIITIIKNLNDI